MSIEVEQRYMKKKFAKVFQGLEATLRTFIPGKVLTPSFKLVLVLMILPISIEIKSQGKRTCVNPPPELEQVKACGNKGGPGGGAALLDARDPSNIKFYVISGSKAMSTA